MGPNGALIVLDLGAREVVAVDPKSRAKTVVANDLPVGLFGTSGVFGAGVAIGGDGDIYVTSDIENAIYRRSVANAHLDRMARGAELKA